jgi:hypothetical protein
MIFVLGGGDIGRALPSLILLSLDGEPSGRALRHETAISAKRAFSALPDVLGSPAVLRS